MAKAKQSDMDMDTGVVIAEHLLKDTSLDFKLGVFSGALIDIQRNHGKAHTLALLKTSIKLIEGAE